MKYAIVQLGGKQFKIQEGSTFEIERQTALKFDVLFYADGKDTKIGTPYLTDVEIAAEVLDEIRGAKIRVARFKSKSRYRKVKGHRQPLSVVKINGVSVKGSAAVKPVRKSVEKPKAKVGTTKKVTAKKTAVKKPVVKRVVKKKA